MKAKERNVRVEIRKNKTFQDSTTGETVNTDFEVVWITYGKKKLARLKEKDKMEGDQQVHINTVAFQVLDEGKEIDDSMYIWHKEKRYDIYRVEEFGSSTRELIIEGENRDNS